MRIQSQCNKATLLHTFSMLKTGAGHSGDWEHPLLCPPPDEDFKPSTFSRKRKEELADEKTVLAKVARSSPQAERKRDRAPKAAKVNHLKPEGCKQPPKAKQDVKGGGKKKPGGKDEAMGKSVGVVGSSKDALNKGESATARAKVTEMNAGSRKRARQSQPLAAGATSTSDFKENVGRQLPAITTRHLQTGEKPFVLKVVNSSSGAKRLHEALQGRPVLVWRLAFKFRAARDESDDEELAEPPVGEDSAPLPDCEVPEYPTENDDVVGMAVACSGDTCWFVSALAFRSPADFWGVCAHILTTGDALKVKHENDLFVSHSDRHAHSPHISNSFQLRGCAAEMCRDKNRKSVGTQV